MKRFFFACLIALAAAAPVRAQAPGGQTQAVTQTPAPTQALANALARPRHIIRIDATLEAVRGLLTND